MFYISAVTAVINLICSLVCRIEDHRRLRAEDRRAGFPLPTLK